MIKKLIERVVGIDKIREEAAKAAAEAQSAREAAEAAKLEQEAAEAAAKQAKEDEAFAKLSPKERATQKGEPWIAVLDTKVNPENPRNGFFELDWNELFIVQLKQAGYGADGDPEEEIVDRWFRELTYQMFLEGGQDPTRGSGYINVVPISQNRAEVS